MQAVLKMSNGPRSRPPLERSWRNAYKSSDTPGSDKPGAVFYLYIAYCKGLAKIGVTQNPKLRISNMQGGNPFLIELIYSVGLSRDMAAVAEEGAILELNDAHWLGDWFKVSRSHARFVVTKVVKKLQADGGSFEGRAGHRENDAFPGMRRKVVSPEGEVFESCTAAAASIGVSRQAMFVRVANGWKGWKYAE